MSYRCNAAIVALCGRAQSFECNHVYLKQICELMDVVLDCRSQHTMDHLHHLHQAHLRLLQAALVTTFPQAAVPVHSKRDGASAIQAS